MEYRRKEIVVEAFRFDGNAEITAPGWFMKAVQKERIFIDRCIRDGAVQVYGCTVQAGCGKLKAKVGDYIVKEPSGEIRPCKAGEFKKQYERI